MYGPLAHNIDDLAIMQEILMSKSFCDMDLYAAPSYFSRTEYELWKYTKRPLRIGYFEYDSLFTCSSSVLKTIRQAKDSLIAHGHTVIPFNTEFLFRVFKVYGGLCLNG